MGRFQKTLFRPIEPREVYICRSIEREWPSGEWVEEPAKVSTPLVGQAEREGGESGSSAVASPAPSLTIIGGAKYDEEAFTAYLNNVSLHTLITTGDGRGAEQVAADWNAWDLTRKYAPDPDTFGKSARKVNVEQVLSHDLTSPVLLVGTGERVKQAKAWLKRARWPREVIELP